MGGMTSALYNRDLLRLATGLAAYPPLAVPDVLVERSARVCGSRVALSLHVGGAGEVTAAGIDARSCAIGQASAALLMQAVGHLGSAETAARLAQIRHWLSGGPLPDQPGFALLAPAIPHSARHAALLLPWEAAVEALQRSESRNEATASS